MRQNVWKILFAVCLVWALIVSGLYWQLKSNPRVVAITSDMALRDRGSQTAELNEMEKITFLRQYLERYFTYDSNNFWQSQTSLAFLMGPELREKRIQEVQRLREKIQSKTMNQKSQLLSLVSNGKDSYSAVLSIQISEDKGKISSIILSTVLSLTTAERTLENPWGLLVNKMDILLASQDQAKIASDLGVSRDTPLVITFPCAIENVESTSESLQTKITTLNVSELQLSSKTSLSVPIQLTAFCKEKEYHFTLSETKSHAT
ncbi:MAG: hypothetical protein J7501_15455, partial [Bdellovibrio sp.]|nr:hypothetical protein [Bdellovibrio sp.]